MKNSKNDSELAARAQELIHNYLNGSLSNQEKESFWEFMIAYPQFYKELKLNASLMQLKRQNPELFDDNNQGNDSGHNNPDDMSLTEDEPVNVKSLQDSYLSWGLVMVAIIILVAGFNLLKVSSPTSGGSFIAEVPADLPALAEIDYFYFESIPSYRDELSNDPFVQKFDASLIAAFSDDYETALQLSDELIESYPEDPRTSIVYMNAGIIHYNLEQYANAITRFQSALSKIDDDSFFEEKAWWFIANAQLNTGELENARASLRIVESYSGDFVFDAAELLKSIEPYME